MAGGKEKSGTYRHTEETEQYTIPAEAKNNLLTHVFGILIDSLINGILDYYIHDEDADVRKVWHDNGLSQNLEIRSYLGEKIKELNAIQGNIPHGTKTIQIPTNVAFFSEAFKGIKILQRAQGSLQIIRGQLDQFHFNECLERIVDGQNISLTEEAQSWIFTALHAMRTHTCSHEHVSINQNAVKEGIKIFQKEYMETNWTNRESEPGKICKETLLAMNKALFDGWKRALYFYYYNENNPMYINDEDIRVNINNGKEIYAQETGGAEILMGTRRTYLPHHGIRRYATTQPYTPGTNDGIPEKVCSAIAKSEGNEGGKPGGFDTINEYDPVCLSVGLFHWNRDGLWDLLNKFKTDSPDNFNTFIKQHGLDIKGYRIFVIEGKDYRSDSLKEELRRLTFVYRFIKAADNAQFRQAQIKHSQEWLK
jgi:hypothetical protein